MKCDETKPTCQQCARRNVECGGYRKDYKWRPFGETSFVPNKPPAPKPKKEVVVRANRDNAGEISKSPSNELEKQAEKPSSIVLEKDVPTASVSPQKEDVESPQESSKASVVTKVTELSPDDDEEEEELGDVFEFEGDSMIVSPELDDNLDDSTAGGVYPSGSDSFMDENMLGMTSAPLPLSISFLNMAPARVGKYMAHGC